ncbi:hypothetical protein ABT354_31110 [Streptomyces sp. NPDC000594]|uniref:hypothetical protein n=1 Tax=Streptomyces sp. NPDC000594 TaxID=3154261 RepID=UPI00331DCD6C
MSHKRRTFSISNVSRSAGEGVLDIPSLSVLRYKSPAVLLKEFKDTWGVDARAVALPVAESDGLLYEIDGLQGVPLSSHAQPSQVLKGFEDVVEEFLKAKKDIILSFCPTMGYIPGEGLQICDISGVTTPQPCIANPRSTEVLGAILGTGIDIVQEVASRRPGCGLKGIALDVTDLWGMSGELGRVEATCFCTACTGHFTETAPELLKYFKTFPNPWSLLLRPTATGIDFASEVPPGITPEEIVGIARQRKYIEQFPGSEQNELLEYANLLLRYMRSRHALTLGAIGALFDYATQDMDEKFTRILIMEGETYGWTSGIWLEELENEYRNEENRSFDELWLNVTPGYLPRTVPYRAYMWRRSRYTINNFFDLAGSLSSASMRANTLLSQMSTEECRRLVAERWQRVHGSALSSQAALVSLPRRPVDGETDTDVRCGFVGVGLDREFGDRFSDQMVILPSRADNNTARPTDSHIASILRNMQGNKDSRADRSG